MRSRSPIPLPLIILVLATFLSSCQPRASAETSLTQVPLQIATQFENNRIRVDNLAGWTAYPTENNLVLRRQHTDDRIGELVLNIWEPKLFVDSNMNLTTSLQQVTRDMRENQHLEVAGPYAFRWENSEAVYLLLKDDHERRSIVIVLHLHPSDTLLAVNVSGTSVTMPIIRDELVRAFDALTINNQPLRGEYLNAIVADFEDSAPQQETAMEASPKP